MYYSCKECLLLHGVNGIMSISVICTLALITFFSWRNGKLYFRRFKKKTVTIILYEIIRYYYIWAWCMALLLCIPHIYYLSPVLWRWLGINLYENVSIWRKKKRIENFMLYKNNDVKCEIQTFLIIGTIFSAHWVHVLRLPT